VAFDPEEEHALRSAAGRYRSLDILSEPLAPDRAKTLEPALTLEIRVAYHIPATAQVRNPRHLKALIAACTRQGVDIRPGTEVVDFDQSQSAIRGVRTRDGAHLSAAKTVVAAGAWSGPLLSRIGVDLPVHPVRGQMLLLRPESPVLERILHWDKQYLVPRIDGRVLVGSTQEEVGFDRSTTKTGINALRATAIRLCPALDTADVERTWAGLRPASRDGKPYMGPVPGQRGLYVATGHFRSGLQLSPATGQVMKEILMDQPPTVPLDEFRIDRERP
jgi:glycine oxidase